MHLKFDLGCDFKTVHRGSKLKPHAPYVLLLVHVGYTTSMRKHVVKGKLQSLKSHDMHVFVATNISHGTSTCPAPVSLCWDYGWMHAKVAQKWHFDTSI